MGRFFSGRRGGLVCWCGREERVDPIEVGVKSGPDGAFCFVRHAS